jgi:hypothetical protein
MKRPKNIVFRLLFLFAVLFCLSVEVYTGNNVLTCNTELSSDQNFKENTAFSHVDSFEDDHINQTYVFSDFVNQVGTIPISKDAFLSKEVPFPNWKPPKYS